MIRFRRDNPVFSRGTFFAGEQTGPGGEVYQDVQWYAPRGKALDWTSPRTPLACWIHGNENAGRHLFLAFNNTHTTTHFLLPELSWQLRVRTDAESPIGEDGVFGSEPVAAGALHVPPGTLMILDSSASTRENP
jgi:pullulanase/glycogen debranching enzyme